jgi:hypothetical protein
MWKAENQTMIEGGMWVPEKLAKTKRTPECPKTTIAFLKPPCS